MKDYFADYHIPCEILYSSKRKTSEIRVSLNGIKIKVPYETTEQEVIEIINEEKQKILERYLELKTKQEQYKIRTDESYVLKRTKELASLIGVNPSKILIKNLKSSWGSATINNVISINSKLFRAPKKAMDYIIIHELCHLKIRGHSSAYWDLVKIYMPDYKDQIEWLKKHGRFI